MQKTKHQKWITEKKRGQYRNMIEDGHPTRPNDGTVFRYVLVLGNN